MRDAAEIRHAAIAEGVRGLTPSETAIAAAEALDPAIAAQVAEVRSIGEWLERVAALRRETAGHREMEVPAAAV